MTWAFSSGPRMFTLAAGVALGALAAAVGVELVAARRAPAAVADGSVAGSAATIVDVSRAALEAYGGSVIPLLGLRPGERIVAVDGQLAGRAVEDPVARAWAAAAPGEFLDLAVSSGRLTRRILVLVE